MTAPTDFRVLQTYEQIGQLIRDAVEAQFLSDDEGRDPPPDWWVAQVERQAKRVAEYVLGQLDAAEE